MDQDAPLPEPSGPAPLPSAPADSAEELRRREERLEFVLEGNEDGFWDWNVRTNEVVFSRRWKEMLGYAESEISDRLEEWSDRVHPEDLPWVVEAIQAHFRGETPTYQTEHRMRHKSGEWIWVLDRGRARRDEQGRVVRMLGTHTDVSARRRADEQLRQAKLAAEAADRAKSEFLAMISHEIRTPLNGVIGFTHLLKASGLRPDQVELVNTIEASGQSLLTLINDILDFSRIEAGKLEFDPQPASLKDEAMVVERLLASRALEKGLELEVKLSPELPGRVRIDAQRWRQVLLNLLGNAVKFTERGRVSLEMGVVARPGYDGGAHWLLRCTVRDTGIGMTAEQMGRIFHPFIQADGSTARRHGGSGLGLAISRRLALAMGGDISVESRLGEGSSFSLTFQAGDLGAAAREDGVAATAPGEALPRVGDEVPLRILVVEDNPVNQRLALALLAHLGYEPRLAADGPEAIDWYSRSPYELVLMDLHLPGMDGFATTAELRRLEKGLGLPRAYIVALTADALPSDRARCLDAGMDDYLSKPLRVEELVALLRRLA